MFGGQSSDIPMTKEDKRGEIEESKEKAILGDFSVKNPKKEPLGQLTNLKQKKARADEEIDQKVVHDERNRRVCHLRA